MDILWGLVESAVMLLVFGLVFALLERIIPERPKKLFRKESLVDIAFYMLGPFVVRVAELLTKMLSGRIAHPALAQLTHGVGAASSLPLWAQIILIALIHDFVGYWVHRWMHSEMLWPIHSTHHTSADVNWLSLFRLHPLDSMLLHVLRTLPLVLLGFGVLPIGIYGIFFGIWGMIVHANVRLPVGPLRFILVTPIHHHRHHALLADGERGKNYAAVFSFWDRIFGTLDPVRQFPERYGLSPQPTERVGRLLLSPFAMWRDSFRQRARRGAREC